MMVIEPVTDLVSKFRHLLDLLNSVYTRVFQYDKYGDHVQTYQTQLLVLPSHDWVVYNLGPLLGSVGHKGKDP